MVDAASVRFISKISQKVEVVQIFTTSIVRLATFQAKCSGTSLYLGGKNYYEDGIDYTVNCLLILVL